MSENYYEILGLSTYASIEDIKKSYRKLALKTHPDKNNGDDTEFKRINSAYEILSNEESKQEYDNKLKFSSTNNFPFSNNFPFIPFINSNMQGFSININSMRMNETINENEKCTTCNGKGLVMFIQQQNNITIQQLSSCNNCNGTGKFINL